MCRCKVNQVLRVNAGWKAHQADTRKCSPWFPCTAKNLQNRATWFTESAYWPWPRLWCGSSNPKSVWSQGKGPVPTKSKTPWFLGSFFSAILIILKTLSGPEKVRVHYKVIPISRIWRLQTTIKLRSAHQDIKSPQAALHQLMTRSPCSLKQIHLAGYFISGIIFFAGKRHSDLSMTDNKQNHLRVPAVTVT